VRLKSGAKEDLGDLHLIDLAGKDAVMAAPDGRASIINPTPLWRGVASLVADIKPKLIVLDTAADVYAGNENIRPEVRQLVGILRGLAIAHDLAAVLSSHPSLTGLTSGSGTSGSTGWNNSARARLYLERFKTSEGKELDPDLRILRVMKANYGPAGQETRLRWSNGCLVLDGQTGSLDKIAEDAKAERVFLDLLATFTAQGRVVSDSSGANYAPAAFANQGSAPMSNKALKAAMERLFLAKRIRAEPYGPPSRQRRRIIEETAH
jgi:RecA-family ATPase